MIDVRSLVPCQQLKQDMQHCDVCDATDFEPLADIRSARIPEFYGHAAICRNCGFVTQCPRPDSAVYAAVNDRWFGFAFSDDPEAGATESQRTAKAEVLWQRIAPHYPDGIGSVLDIGAGQGWSLRFLKARFPDIETAAIERSPAARATLRHELGVNLLAETIHEDWHQAHKAQFDLIVFRHTLEHLERPGDALARIATALSPNGLAYIVVPNAMAIRDGAAIRTDFLRPVHLHYFNRHTLERLAWRSGLIADAIEVSGEIAGMFRHAGDGESGGASVCTYAEQKALLETRLHQARSQDRWAIVRMDIRRRCPPALLNLLRRVRGTPKRHRTAANA